MKNYNFNYNYLAQKLVEIIKVNESGSISYSEAFLKQDIDSIIETAHKFAEDTPKYEYNSIVRKGIKKFIKKTVRNGETLRRAIKAAENEFRSKPYNKYILISTLSFKYFNSLKSLRFNGTTVKFYKTLPSKYRLENIKTLVSSYFSEPYPSDYTIVECHVASRSVFEAIDKSFKTIDFIRGLWNISINFRNLNRIFSGKLKPINSIRLGPVHTLHHPNGKLVLDNFWYEIDCYVESADTSLMKQWANINRAFIFLRKNINKVKFKDEIREIFIRYVRALDSMDFESSYLKLWSLLEFLTNTQRMNYDKTITRTLFFYKDDIHNKEILEHLRLLRNKMIHIGESRSEMDPVIFQLKRFVEGIIIFLVNSKDYFNDMEEVGYFLDLSTDYNILKKEIKFRKRVFTLFKLTPN